MILRKRMPFILTFWGSHFLLLLLGLSPYRADCTFICNGYDLCSKEKVRHFQRVRNQFASYPVNCHFFDHRNGTDLDGGKRTLG